jgi:hypothetical protein
LNTGRLVAVNADRKKETDTSLKEQLKSRRKNKMDSLKEAKQLTVTFFGKEHPYPSGQITLFDELESKFDDVTSPEAIDYKLQVYTAYMEHLQTQEFVMVEAKGNSVRMLPKQLITEIRLEVTEVENNGN